MAQSVSPPDPGSTSDSRPLTDLYRGLNEASRAWRDADYAPAEGRPYAEAWEAFRDRLRDIGARLNHAAIREHAQVEHPGVAWDEQGAVFTTGRFAEGRAR
jgi:hypothetical protein